LERALAGPPFAAAADARRIADESAPNMLTGSGRAANVPTFVLMVLLPTHQARFAFTKKGEKRVEGTAVWVVGYRETRRPMFFRTADGQYVPMTGELWIEPASGAVFRAKYVVDSADALRDGAGADPDAGGPPGRPRLEANLAFSRMNVDVTFRQDPALGALLPVEMREILSRTLQAGPDGPALGSAAATHFLPERLSCVATYTKVRRVVGRDPGAAP
jgi:hypothetical protein